MNHTKDYLAAIKHYESGEFDASIKILETIPDSFNGGSALALKGLIYKINNNHRDAYKALKKYLGKNKSSQIFKVYLDLLLDLNLIEEFLKLTNNNQDSDLFIQKIRKDFLVGDIDIAQEKINSIKEKNDDLIYFSSLIDLEKGNFQIGFENYRSRWNADLSGLKGKNNFSDLPKWDGKKLNSLLIWGEQGIGDQIFFSRFVPQISKLVGNITLLVSPKIKNLLSTLFLNTNINVIDFEKNIGAYDAQLALGCSPMFASDLKQVTNTYLEHNEIGSQKRVGFSWKSTNPTEGVFRSIPSNGLADIKCPNSDLINLQFGDIEEDLRILESSGNKIFYNANINYDDDIDKVALELLTCSHVITVPNTIAHLAGLLNIKTYLINPIGRGSFWYWRNVAGESNFWYKNIVNVEVTSDKEKITKVNEILNMIGVDDVIR